MKVRKRILVMGILFFLLGISTLQSVKASSFHSGVNKGDILIWKCGVCNGNKMKHIFGDNWSSSDIFKGIDTNFKMKWQISTISYNKSYLIINYLKWKWSNNFGNSENASILSLNLNISQKIDYNFSNRLPFINFLLPVPLRAYLEDIHFTKWYEIDTRVINMIYVDLQKDTIDQSYPNESIHIVVEYKENGILDSYKIYLQNNQVIFDVSLDSIPIYTIPVTIGLVLGSLVGICYYIIKIRKNRKAKKLK
ncbi:MAG: hypothetical protein P8Y97_02850 [Candidatus Lokiarchaeota archaeon]